MLFRLNISQRLNWFLVLASIVAFIVDRLRLILCRVCRHLIATDRLILIAHEIPVFIKSAASLRPILMILNDFEIWFDFTFLFPKSPRC